MQRDLARYLEATPQKVLQAAKQFIQLDQAVRLDIVPGKKEAEVTAASTKGGAQ